LNVPIRAEEWYPVPPGAEPPPPPGVAVEGLEPGESLVMHLAPGDKAHRLAFKSPPFQDYCNPMPHQAYRVAKTGDGTVIVVRLIPKVKIVKKYIPGSCAVGCGPPPPPPRSEVLVLPPTTRVRIEATTYETEVEQITCDNPMPAQ
jgi:hypothetical protein